MVFTGAVIGLILGLLLTVAQALSGPLYLPPEYHPRFGLNQNANFTRIWNRTHSGDINACELIIGRELDSFGPEQIERLNQYRIVFAGGFFSEFIVEFQGSLLAQASLNGYFNEQMEWLQRNGVENVGRVRVLSTRSRAENAPLIAEVIANSDRPVIFIGHSKGGLDALDVLVTRPELRAKVAALIAIQSPFEGAPLVDQIMSRAVTRFVAGQFVQQFYGDPQVLADFTTQARNAYMAIHAERITKLLEEVPVISIGSDAGEKTLFTLSRTYMRLLGYPENDGLVPVQSSLLRGSVPLGHFINIDGVDHGNTVGEMFIAANDFSRIRFMKSILRLTLEVIENSN